MLTLPWELTRGTDGKAERLSRKKRHSATWLMKEFPIRAVRFDLAANGTHEQELEASAKRSELLQAVSKYSASFDPDLVARVERYTSYLQNFIPSLYPEGSLVDIPIAVETSRIQEIWRGRDASMPYSDVDGFLPEDRELSDRDLQALTALNFHGFNRITARSVVSLLLDSNTSFTMYFGSGGPEGGWINTTRAMLAFFGSRDSISANVLRFLEPFDEEKYFACRLLQASWRDFVGSGDFVCHKVSDIRRAYE